MQGRDGAHWAGVDWGQRVHDVCVLDTHGEVLAERRFDHSSKGLGELSAFLSGFADVQVGIETPRGPVVEALLDRELAVLPSTRSSSTASVTASTRLAPRTTAATPTCSLTR